MQANNKGDATQVYEGAERATRVGVKDSFKYLLKPLTIFGYHYFVEGIKAVQKDGPTKELDKLTNLSYDETIRVMEKCQKDGVRVVAAERKLSADDNEFGKKKSMYQQKRITKYSRRIRALSNIKANYPKVSKLLHLDAFIKRNEAKQNEKVESHKNKHYNIYFNKSREGYMANRIADIIEYRTGISQKLFDKDTQAAIEKIKKEGMTLNAVQLKDLHENFKLHDLGNVEIDEFNKDYCIHEMSFSAFMNIKDDLEISDIPYGLKVISNEDKEETVDIYFQNKHLERYNELGFNDIGQIRVFGNDNKNLQWDIKSQDELVSFTTKTGDEEKQTYSSLSGKNYIMKRQENECLWTVFRSDLKELAEKEKKRNVVNEELENLHIFEELEKQVENSPTLTEDKNIEINFDIEKEAGDD